MKAQEMTQIASIVNKQRGVTLMELIASLAVMSVVVVGAVALYNAATSSELSATLNRDLTAIQAATKQIFIGQGTYGENNPILNDILVAAKKIPTTIVVNTVSPDPDTLTHRGNGTVEVKSTGSSFTITLTNIEKDVCIPLMTSASTWSKVKVGNADERTSFPITPATAQTDCAAEGNTMVFTN